MSQEEDPRRRPQTLTVREFHASRNSLRKTQVIANADGSVGFAARRARVSVARDAVEVNPGDILLLDNRGRQPARPRHDRDVVRHRRDVPDRGERGGRRREGRGRLGRRVRHPQPAGLDHPRTSSSPTTRRLRLSDRKEAHKANPSKPWTDADEQELTEVNATITEFERTHPKQKRIAAVCRFSIVDFEQHDYV